MWITGIVDHPFCQLEDKIRIYVTSSASVFRVQLCQLHWHETNN